LGLIYPDGVECGCLGVVVVEQVWGFNCHRPWGELLTEVNCEFIERVVSISSFRVFRPLDGWNKPSRFSIIRSQPPKAFEVNGRWIFEKGANVVSFDFWIG